jgi:hypothetical protein
LQNNTISAESFQTAMQSWTLGVPGTVSIDLSGNNITRILPELFVSAVDGEAASGTVAEVDLNLRGNPICTIEDDVFFTQAPEVGELFDVGISLSIDISEATGGPLIVPDVFNFSGPLFGSRLSTLSMRMRRTGVSAAAGNAFRDFSGGTLSIDLSENGLRHTVPLDPIAGQPILNLNLSHNNLTSCKHLHNVNGTIDISYNQVRCPRAGCALASHPCFISHTAVYFSSRSSSPKVSRT